MPKPESKLPGVGTTIFTVMSRLAEDCGAINLSQGFPDFQPDAELARWLTKKHGVAVIPVSAFCEDPPETRFIRFCFAKESATLTEAAERLSNL